MDNYREQFIAEALELLMKLEKSLLALEKNPEEPLTIEEIFRGFHTLKGSSSMYGFDKVGQLMHLIESVFERIRDKKKNADNKLINLSLEVLDLCSKILKKNDELSVPIVSEFEVMMARIKEQNDVSVSHTGSNYFDGKNEGTGTLSTYFITFVTDSQFDKRGVKLESILSELEQLGTLITIPLKEGNYLERWELFLVSMSPIQDIEDIFIFLLDIILIERLSEENLFLNNEFKQIIQKNAALKVRNEPEELRSVVARIIREKKEKENRKQPEEQQTQSSKNYLRVAAEKLDEQMDLLSELVTAKAELRLIVENEKYTKLNKLVESFDKVTNRFRKNILNVRLVQVKQWYVMFLRLVRDVSKQLNKEVEFLAEGLETEIDKNIIDSLEGPLTHLIRNSLDHGIETPEERIKAGKPTKGTIVLKAYHSGSEIVIEISDDGRGFNKEEIYRKAISKGIINPDSIVTEKQLFDYVFLPGFSTATAISQVSGRGVGMDVVKKAINQLRGDIEIRSVEGKGTDIIIRLPMLLSIIDTLLIRSENQYFAIPLPDVSLCSQVSTKELEAKNNDQFTLGGELIPYINLRKVFGIKGAIPEKQKVVIIENNHKHVGLITDEVIGEYQAVLKPFDGYYINKQYFIGASLLADGHLCVILDTMKLLSDNIFLTK